MKIAIIIIITVLSLGYPAAVYFGVQHASPAVFALVLFAITAVKFILNKSQVSNNTQDSHKTHGASEGAETSRFDQTPILLIMAIYSIVMAFTNEPWVLRLYPVIISLCMAGIFALTLFEGESLIERFSRMAGKVITPNAKRYTRKLTGIWAGVLTINAIFAFILAIFGTLKIWALYCGIISYGVFAVFIIGELIYRQYYIKKYGA